MPTEFPPITKDDLNNTIERLEKDIAILSQWKLDKDIVPNLQSVIAFLKHLLIRSDNIK